MNRAVTQPRCACAKPMPSTMAEETFVGLFADTPAETSDAVICMRCSGIARDWRPCAPHNVTLAGAA